MELRLATGDELHTYQFPIPTSATADVTIRRLQLPMLAFAKERK